MRIVYITCIIACVITTASYSQTAKKQPGMKSKTEYEETFVKGSPGQVIDNKVEYDASGNVTKEYFYNSEGKLKSLIVYTYKNNNKESETFYGPDNKIIEKHVYTYNARGDKIQKITTNGQNKVIKKKTYSYEYYQ
ncbi:MAG TPA: hypothetical protein PK199_02675 [Bacteroidales bacterium]|nr:hypothetical protein [Bacteroidales bacterium]